MPIPLLDLRAQYQSIKPELDAAIQRVLESGQFILGPEVEAFEREMAAYCGAAHAVGVASGTDALELSLRAYGVGPGDEVITTAFSFFATAEAILAVGALPVFIDIEPVTYNLDPSQLTGAVTKRTKAILPVHLFGHPCDIETVTAFARARHLKVVEDCAQAIGAEVRGKRVGTFGDAAAFSFYPTKNLGGYGDGGMVITNDPQIAEQVRLLRAHGSRERYRHPTLGTNSRLDELQAAILRVKLRHLDQWNEARRALAARYHELIAAQCASQVTPPQERPSCRHVYHLYAVRSPIRDQLAHALAEESIATQICYPGSMPSQPALAGAPSSRGIWPCADEVAKTILALPLYPELTAEQQRRVINGLSMPVKSA